MKKIRTLIEKKEILIVNIITLVFVILAFISSVLQLTEVVGTSMLPTFKDGDYVILNIFADKTNISRGEVIVFKAKDTFFSEKYIKRVVAIPGDIISVKDKILYVNGEESPYQFDGIETAGILSDECTLKDGEYFVMGDNREVSTDSRSFGPIQRKQIIGTVTKHIKINRR